MHRFSVLRLMKFSIVVLIHIIGATPMSHVPFQDLFFYGSIDRDKYSLSVLPLLSVISDLDHFSPPTFFELFIQIPHGMILSLLQHLYIKFFFLKIIGELL